MTMTDDQKIAHYHRRGWCPVPWAHHPPHVRAAIRAVGFRPGMKACFANAARVTLGQRAVPLTYVEGWVTARLPIPFEHAWVEDADGVAHDLTLPGDEVSVRVSWRVDADALRRTLVARRTYGPAEPERFVATRRDAYAAAGIRYALDAEAEAALRAARPADPPDPA